MNGRRHSVNNKSDRDDFLADEPADPESRTRFEEITPLVEKDLLPCST